MHASSRRIAGDQNAAGVPSVPDPVTTTTTTTTATTHTQAQQNHRRIEALEAAVSGADGVPSLDELRQLVGVLQAFDGRLNDTTRMILERDSTIQALTAELAATRTELTETRANIDAGLGSIARWAANGTDLRALQAQVSTMVSAAAASRDRPLVSSDPGRVAEPPRISADGESISVSANACGGTVDICEAAQQIDALTNALAGGN